MKAESPPQRLTYIDDEAGDAFLNAALYKARRLHRLKVLSQSPSMVPTPWWWQHNKQTIIIRIIRVR
jgi:hypothetical protein